MKTMQAFGWAALLLAGLSTVPASFAAGNDKIKAEKHAVAFTAMNAADYQNFLKNWDDARQPVFLALIRTPAEYAAIFSPAPVMRDQRPFAPEAGMYAKEQILVVGRVTTAPDKGEKILEVERISARGTKLDVHYSYVEPAGKATYTVKNILAVRIAKAPYKKLRFFENGKLVGTLKPTN